MTLVTEGGMEMNREEKKEWLKARKDNINIVFYCSSVTSCRECPFTTDGHGCNKNNKEKTDLLKEVWTEEHDYIKNEKVELEKIAADPSKIGPTITVKDTTDKQLNPDHYKAGKLQVIEQMLIMYGVNAVSSFCKLNVYKYHARAGLKGDASMDHKKADWYMRLYDRLKSFGSMDGEKALEALREFLKEKNENAANH